MEAISGSDNPDTVVGRIAAPTTHVVTLSITEKGYRIDPSTGSLTTDEQVQADLAGQPPMTAIGQLTGESSSGPALGERNRWHKPCFSPGLPCSAQRIVRRRQLAHPRSAIESQHWHQITKLAAGDCVSPDGMMRASSA